MSLNYRKRYQGNFNKIYLLLSIIVILVYLCLIFLPTPKGLAEKNINTNTNQSSEDKKVEQLSKLRERINQKAYEIERCSNKINEYTDIIEQKQKEIISLKNEIEIFDAQIAKTEIEIDKVSNEIDYFEMEIANLVIELNLKENQLNLAQENIAGYIRQINRNDRKSSLEILLSEQPLYEFFNQQQYLKDTQKSLIKLVNSLSDFKNDLQASKVSYEIKKDKLKDLEIELKQKKNQLKIKQNAKRILLEETQDSEVKFLEMLELIQNEKANIENEMAALESEIKIKLKEHNFDFDMNPDDILLMWPVPYKGITAYFHDPEYPYRRYIGEHAGIDLRTLEHGVPTNGTPVKAAASGIIIKTIENGKYVGNAVYIAHSDNLVTCYFHLSEVHVTEDEVVAVGQKLGLSGGMPGTYGAGLSTGPHLHFEVRLNGVAVNPLQFLP